MDTFWDTFRAYIRSYLPQWRYGPDGGEVESAVLLAAVELIGDSAARLDRLPEKYQLAFLQGWPLEPLEPDPMCTYAALAAPEGRPVPAGTKFYLSGDGRRLWQTAEDAQAEIRLTDLFCTSRGEVFPLPLPAPGHPVRLFDFREGRLPGPEIRFSHPDAFRSRNGCRTALALPEAPAQMLALFCGSAACWHLIGASGGEYPLAAPVRENRHLLFRLPAGGICRPRRRFRKAGGPVPCADLGRGRPLRRGTLAPLRGGPGGLEHLLPCLPGRAGAAGGKAYGFLHPVHPGAGRTAARHGAGSRIPSHHAPPAGAPAPCTGCAG